MAQPPVAHAFPKLIEELEDKLSSADPGPIADLLRPFEQFFSGLMSRKEYRSVHDFGLRLWNHAVAWKKKTMTQGIYGVEFRAIALEAVTRAEQPIDGREEYLIQMLGNYARLGQLWTEFAKYDRSSHAFNQAEQYATRLRSNFAKGDEALTEKRQRNMFCMLVWRAQTHLALQQSEAALRLIFQAKELLADLPAEIDYLSLNVCYNAAVQCQQTGRHSEARRLLEVGISVYELSADRVPDSEARLLRLLASVLLQLEEYEKALKCAQLSLEKSPSTTAEIIKYRIALRLKQFADAETTLHQMMNREDVSVDHVVYAITLLAESDPDACDRAFQEFESRLLLSALRQKNADRVKLHHFTWLLKAQRTQEAKAMIEQAISQHLDGTHKLSVEIAKELQARLWNLGVERFENREHALALEWFMHCFRLSEFSESTHKASLLRVISRCYLALGNLSFSLEFAAQAYSVEPRNMLSSYLLFTVFVEQKNVTEASKVLQRFVASEFDPSLLEVLGFEAFERSQFLLACEALELWMQQFRDASATLPEHFPRIAHTLTRLLIQENAAERKFTQRISSVLRFTADRLATMAQSPMFAKVLEDAKWLMGAAWNCGIEACKDGALDLTYQLMTSAADIAALLPAEAEQRRLALIVAIAAGVELLGNGNAPEPAKLLARAEEARSISTRTDSSDKASPLLAVLDFKLRERLGEPNLMPLLRSATQAPGATPTLIAMLANDAQTPEVTREAFRTALRMCLAGQSPDYHFAAQLLWRLANLCKTKEDVVALLDEFNGFLASAEMPQEFLENFVVLMYRAGVHFKSIRKTQLAEKVLARALNLLKNLHERAHLEDALLAAYQSLNRKPRADGLDEHTALAQPMIEQ